MAQEQLAREELQIALQSLFIEKKKVRELQEKVRELGAKKNALKERLKEREALLSDFSEKREHSLTEGISISFRKATDEEKGGKFSSLTEQRTFLRTKQKMLFQLKESKIFSIRKLKQQLEEKNQHIIRLNDSLKNFSHSFTEWEEKKSSLEDSLQKLFQERDRERETREKREQNVESLHMQIKETLYQRDSLYREQTETRKKISAYRQEQRHHCFSLQEQVREVKEQLEQRERQIEKLRKTNEEKEQQIYELGEKWHEISCLMEREREEKRRFVRMQREWKGREERYERALIFSREKEANTLKQIRELRALLQSQLETYSIQRGKLERASLFSQEAEQQIREKRTLLQKREREQREELRQLKEKNRETFSLLTKQIHNQLEERLLFEKTLMEHREFKERSVQQIDFLKKTLSKSRDHIEREEAKYQSIVEREREQITLFNREKALLLSLIREGEQKSQKREESFQRKRELFSLEREDWSQILRSLGQEYAFLEQEWHRERKKREFEKLSFFEKITLSKESRRESQKSFLHTTHHLEKSIERCHEQQKQLHLYRQRFCQQEREQLCQREREEVQTARSLFQTSQRVEELERIRRRYIQLGHSVREKYLRKSIDLQELTCNAEQLRRQNGTLFQTLWKAKLIQTRDRRERENAERRVSEKNSLIERLSFQVDHNILLYSEQITSLLASLEEGRRESNFLKEQVICHERDLLQYREREELLKDSLAEKEWREKGLWNQLDVHICSFSDRFVQAYHREQEMTTLQKRIENERDRASKLHKQLDDQALCCEEKVTSTYTLIKKNEIGNKELKQRAHLYRKRALLYRKNWKNLCEKVDVLSLSLSDATADHVYRFSRERQSHSNRQIARERELCIRNEEKVRLEEKMRIFLHFHSSKQPVKIPHFYATFLESQIEKRQKKIEERAQAYFSERKLQYQDQIKRLRFRLHRALYLGKQIHRKYQVTFAKRRELSLQRDQARASISSLLCWNKQLKEKLQIWAEQLLVNSSLKREHTFPLKKIEKKKENVLSHMKKALSFQRENLAAKWNYLISEETDSISLLRKNPHFQQFCQEKWQERKWKRICHFTNNEKGEMASDTSTSSLDSSTISLRKELQKKNLFLAKLFTSWKEQRKKLSSFKREREQIKLLQEELKKRDTILIRLEKESLEKSEEGSLHTLESKREEKIPRESWIEEELSYQRKIRSLFNKIENYKQRERQWREREREKEEEKREHVSLSQKREEFLLKLKEERSLMEKKWYQTLQQLQEWKKKCLLCEREKRELSSQWEMMREKMTTLHSKQKKLLRERERELSEMRERVQRIEKEQESWQMKECEFLDQRERQREEIEREKQERQRSQELISKHFQDNEESSRESALLRQSLKETKDDLEKQREQCAHFIRERDQWQERRTQLEERATEYGHLREQFARKVKESARLYKAIEDKEQQLNQLKHQMHSTKEYLQKLKEHTIEVKKVMDERLKDQEKSWRGRFEEAFEKLQEREKSMQEREQYIRELEGKNEQYEKMRLMFSKLSHMMEPEKAERSPFCIESTEIESKK